MGKSVRKIPTYNEVMGGGGGKKIPAFEEVMGIKTSSPIPPNFDIPVVEEVDENDIIGLSKKASDLSKKTIDVPVIGGVGGGVMKQKDFDAEKQAESFRKKVRDKGYDPGELSKDFEDFPEEYFAEKPEAKDELLALKKANPIEYKMKLNAVKNQFSVLKSVGNSFLAHLPEDDPHLEYKAKQAGIHAANEWNSLAIADGDSLYDKENKIIGKISMIRENLPQDQQEKAIQRVYEDAAQQITGNSKQLRDEWQQSEFANTLDANQYAGLKTLKLFNPSKYKQAVRLLGMEKKPDYNDPILNTDQDEYIYAEGEDLVDRMRKETTNKLIGQEKVKQDLANEGRRNAATDIQRKMYSLDQAYKNATDEEKPLLQAKFLQYQGALKGLQADESKDLSRYPLLAELKFDNQVKEIMQDPGFSAAGYGLKRFGKGFESSMNSLENVLTSTFGNKAAKEQLELERLGRSQSEASELYLPENLKQINSPFVPKFSKDLSDQIRVIQDDNSLSPDEKLSRSREVMSQNQDKVDWVTNTEGGKSKNFFSKSTLYGNAGMIGDIASIAAQSMLLGSGGAGRIASSTIPMFTATQNDFYQKAVEEGNPNPMSYANTHATIMALAGLINPDLAIVKRTLGMNTAAGKAIAGIDEATWNNIVNGNKGIVDKFKNSATSVAKEAAKMTAVYGAGTSIASDLADKMLGGEDIIGEEIVDRAVEATKHTALNSVALFGINAVRNFKNVSPQEKANIWEAGTNPEITLKGIEDAVKLGEITPEQGKSYTDAAKEISKLMDEVPTENAKGKPLTDKQRIDFLYNKLVASKAKELKSGTTEAKTEEFDGIEAQANGDNNKIISGYIRKTPSEQSIEAKAKEAKGFVDELKEAELISDIEYSAAKEEPMKFFEEVAQQANNVTADKVFNKETDARKAAMDKYGETIVDYANELFPEYKEIAKKGDSKVSVIMPGEIKQVETTTIKPDETIKAGVEGTQPTEAGKETAVPPITPETAESKGEEMRLAHADTEQIYKELGLPERLETPTKKNADLLVEADEMIAKGYDANAKAEKIMKGEDVKFEDKDQVAFAKIVAGLKEKQNGLDIKSPEFDKLQDQIEKLSRAADVAGTVGGRFLQSRKAFVPAEESLADFVMTEKEINKDAPLTDKQKETVQKEYTEITEAQKKYDEKIAALEAENAMLRAEKSLPKKSTQKTKKTHEDFVTERKQIFNSISEKLRKARGESQATFVPYAKELIAISPDVAKLVKNLVEEGVTKLADVVKEVHSQLKEVIPQITEKDVHDIIAGEYSEKKSTRNELSAKLKDLKDEAKLINRLEELEAGVEPKNEKQKIKRNQEIADLQKKIKEHDLTKLSAYKKRVVSDIEKVEEQIKSVDFTEPPKKEPLKLDTEAQVLKDRLIEVKNKRAYRQLTQMYKNQSNWEKGVRYAGEILNIPRALMSSTDLSAMLRQGVVPTVSNPKMATQAAKKMFEAVGSQKRYDEWFFDLQQNPRFNDMKEARLAITDSSNPALQAREEAFMSNLAEKIPGIGRVVKGSNRAYSMYLNKMRVDLYNRFADAMEERGLTLQNSPKEYREMAAYINNSTGRGDIGKTLEAAAPILNSIFFSPRLIAARVNMLTYLAQPRFYRTVPKEVRQAYFKDMAKFIGVGLTVLALAKAGGAEVEDDPRSSDFGKIKSGNTRWDIWGGFQQYARVGAQILTGERKSTNGGKVQKLDGSQAFGTTKGDVAKNFFRGKLAPVPSMAVDVLTGRDVMGNKLKMELDADASKKEVGAGEYLANHLLPLTATGLKEALQDQGVKALFTVGVPSVFGVGTQTYDQPKSKKSSVRTIE